MKRTSLESKIREILENKELDIADKLCEIERLMPKKEDTVDTEIIDTGLEYTDNPRLKNKDDLYYDGCGCTWGEDLDGKRYWKRYCPITTEERFGVSKFGRRYSHLKFGDIFDEKARIKKIVIECLNEI